jgi:hypothetical protein
MEESNEGGRIELVVLAQLSSGQRGILMAAAEGGARTVVFSQDRFCREALPDEALADYSRKGIEVRTLAVDGGAEPWNWPTESSLEFSPWEVVKFAAAAVPDECWERASPLLPEAPQEEAAAVPPSGEEEEAPQTFLIGRRQDTGSGEVDFYLLCMVNQALHGIVMPIAFDGFTSVHGYMTDEKISFCLEQSVAVRAIELETSALVPWLDGRGVGHLEAFTIDNHGVFLNAAIPEVAWEASKPVMMTRSN